jgi:hypothetical protein
MGKAGLLWASPVLRRGILLRNGERTDGPGVDVGEDC